MVDSELARMAGLEVEIKLEGANALVQHLINDAFLCADARLSLR